MKKYLFGLFAVALAVAFSAFTAPEVTSGNITTKYYRFDGATDADLEQMGDWYAETGEVTECGLEQTQVVCFIELPEAIAEETFLNNIIDAYKPTSVSALENAVDDYLSAFPNQVVKRPF